MAIVVLPRSPLCLRRNVLASRADNRYACKTALGRNEIQGAVGLGAVFMSCTLMRGHHDSRRSVRFP